MENSKVVDNLEAAIDLWEKGLNVIPLRSTNPPPTPENTADDFSIFKKPLVTWRKFQNKRLSLEYLKGWFKRKPFLNVGIITNGLVIIDADNQEAVGWCDKNLDNPVVSITAKGKHYYFLKPPEIKVHNSVNASREERVLSFLSGLSGSSKMSIHHLFFREFPLNSFMLSRYKGQISPRRIPLNTEMRGTQ